MLAMAFITSIIIMIWVNSHIKLDVDPQKDNDAPPMSTYRCMLRPT